MSLIKFNSNNPDIVFCFVDRTSEYSSSWTKELIKNQSDYTINNLCTKGYSVLQGYYEDALLVAASKKYKHAVVFSTGTEFINGDQFFNNLTTLINTDYFIAGHILDRKDAYYELHHQCYIVNLKTYKELNYPVIGQQELGSDHVQAVPNRSKENYHDDYTPKWILYGDRLNSYKHKCHGWNIISEGLKHKLPVLSFTEDMRNNKKHFYPENQIEFLKHSEWLYARQNYCMSDFVHTNSTDISTVEIKNIQQVFTPASGTWWIDYISIVDTVKVIVYDYNQKALDYWKSNAPKLSNVSYEFVKIDLLIDKPDFSSFNFKLPTLLNFTNIFAYEATAPFYSLEYRIKKENQLLESIDASAYVNFSPRAASGFIDAPQFGQNLQPIDIKEITRPTWHFGDWL
jgi:hypothetical protein